MKFPGSNIIAHGVGERADLPIPDALFFYGSSIAIFVSFITLSTLWLEPKFEKLSAGKKLQTNPTIIKTCRYALKTIGLIILFLSLIAGFTGEDNVNVNYLPLTIFVIVWVGFLILNGVFGDLWKAINPLMTLSEILNKLGFKRKQIRTAPNWLSSVAAPLAMFVFLFIELIYPYRTSPSHLAWIISTHIIVSLLLGAVYGTQWLINNEPFSALFKSVSKMGIFFTKNRSIYRRPLLTGLTNSKDSLTKTALLLIVLGGTSFDGFSESKIGLKIFSKEYGSGPWNSADQKTLGLLISILLITSLFLAGIWWMKRTTAKTLTELATSYTPLLIPIVFGYAIAHYFQLLIDETQRFFILIAADPLANGSDLIGNKFTEIWLIEPKIVAWIQVLAIVMGHIGSVIVAHDISLNSNKIKDSPSSQYGMILVMVAYSLIGLWLLLIA